MTRSDDSRISRTGIVDSWEAALELLDQYPWFKLYPASKRPQTTG
jgi:hypothetical protein